MDFLRLETLLLQDCKDYSDWDPIINNKAGVSTTVFLHASPSEVLIKTSLPFLTSLCRQLNLQFKLSDSPSPKSTDTPAISLLFAQVSTESKDLVVSALTDARYQKCFLLRYFCCFDLFI
jgi:hypothetical protein